MNDKQEKWSLNDLFIIISLCLIIVLSLDKLESITIPYADYLVLATVGILLILIYKSMKGDSNE